MKLLILLSVVASIFGLPTWKKDVISDPMGLAALISNINNFDGFGLTDAPPCCLPEQWQGNMKAVMGLNSGGPRLFGEEESEFGRGGGKVAAQTLILYVDETNKRIAGKSICPVTKAEWFSFIITFNADKGAALNVFNSTAQKCRTFDLKKAEFKDQCIPSDATFIGTLNIGAASGGLEVDSFTYNHTTNNGVTYSNTLVTSDSCLPIISQTVGRVGHRFFGLANLNIDLGLEDETPNPGPPRGLNFVASSFFYNLQASISDPSVFTPPAYCPKNSMAVDKKISPGVDVMSNFIELLK